MASDPVSASSHNFFEASVIATREDCHRGMSTTFRGRRIKMKHFRTQSISHAVQSARQRSQLLSSEQSLLMIAVDVDSRRCAAQQAESKDQHSIENRYLLEAPGPSHNQWSQFSMGRLFPLKLINLLRNYWLVAPSPHSFHLDLSRDGSASFIIDRV